MDFIKRLSYKKVVLSRRCECKSTPITFIKYARNIADQTSAKVSKQATEILKHYSKTTFLQNNLQYMNWKFLDRKVRVPHKMILADELVAEKIIETIKPNLIKTSEPVFEANPGLGLITKELLKIDKRDLPKICIFENDPFFRKKMLLVCEQHVGRVKMYNTNILDLWKTSFLDKGDSRLKGLMEDVIVKEWNEDPCVKIVGTLPTPHFLHSVVISIVFNYGITTFGRPELYILISPSLYARICKPNRGFETLFNIFFKWQCLMEVDQKALLPWTIKKTKTTKTLTNYGLDPNKFYLLKAEPKKDLYKIIPPELMKPLWYFCKTAIRGKRQRVLPALEKWIPDCGPRLISIGISAFSEFGDLTTDEILQVFLEFVNWPEFSSCLFMTSMEDYLMKSATEPDISDSASDDGSDFQSDKIVSEVRDK